MKIEVGKKYERRNGVISKCIRVEDRIDVAHFDVGVPLFARTELNYSDGKVSPSDIVSEFKEFSPIQEVTTRKIVAGNYGNLSIGRVNEKGNLSIAFYRGDIEPRWYASLNADELETTAATLIEIAKFMKEAK